MTMHKSIREEIKRIFGNRFYELNPFKRGSAGMEWFARAIPLVDQLSRQEVETFLVPLIDKLLKHTKDCTLCTAKLLAFAEIYCCRRSARHAMRYWQQYQQCMQKMSKGKFKIRDFRTEVYEAVQCYLEQGHRG
jgi:hypothetical protein